MCFVRDVIYVSDKNVTHFSDIRVKNKNKNNIVSCSELAIPDVVEAALGFG